MNLIVGNLQGGPLPYDSLGQYFLPLIFVCGGLIVVYLCFYIARRRSPMILDSVTTAAFVWATDGIWRMKLDPSGAAFFGTYLGISFWLVWGTIISILTYIAIRTCVKCGYRAGTGMLIGFVIGILGSLAVPVIT